MNQHIVQFVMYIFPIATAIAQTAILCYFGVSAGGVSAGCAPASGVSADSVSAGSVSVAKSSSSSSSTERISLKASVFRAFA